MRGVAAHSSLIGALVILGVPLPAQPQPPDFCFVISEPGDADKPLSRSYAVQQQYRQREPYFGGDGYWLRPDTTITLQSGDLFQEKNDGWRVFTPIVGVSESRILVIAGTDTMRIELPEDMGALLARAAQRWDRPSPEVMRFKPGRSWDAYTCINEYQAGVATHQFILKRLQREANRVEPPANIPPPGIRPPALRPRVEPFAAPEPTRPSTPEEWAAFWAEQPPLKNVVIDRTSADTVWVRITGRVMLDGGCAGLAPFMAVELRTDTGWVERLPMHAYQLDCGPAFTDWEEHVFSVPLRWWAYNFRGGDDGLLAPGTYRLRFRGGNRKDRHTEPFELQ